MSIEFDLLLQEYQEALQKYELGQLNRNYLFKLGKPCQVLQENGFSEDDIIMFQKTVRKMIEKHNLSLEQIALLPKQLQKSVSYFYFSTNRTCPNCIDRGNSRRKSNCGGFNTYKIKCNKY